MKNSYETWIPLGEFWADRTRTKVSFSGNGWGWNILTAAILGADFNNENLNASESNGLCKKRSELGYSFSIISIIEGPVNSNLLAPPTKHTAIFDRNSSSFESDDEESLLKKPFLTFWKGRSKKKENNIIKARRGIINTMKRRLVSEMDLLKGFINFLGVLTISTQPNFL